MKDWDWIGIDHQRLRLDWIGIERFGIGSFLGFFFIKKFIIKTRPKKLALFGLLLPDENSIIVFKIQHFLKS